MKEPHKARECSAEIDASGRVGCACMKGMPELRADLILCHPRLLELIERANRERTP